MAISLDPHVDEFTCNYSNVHFVYPVSERKMNLNYFELVPTILKYVADIKIHQ